MTVPLSAQEEEFVFKPGEAALKSKFVFEDGKYGARVTDVENGTSKAGKPKYVFKILGIEGPTEGIEYEQHLSLAENAQWKLIEVLDAIGVKPREDGSYNVKEAIGKPVTIYLKQTTNPESGKKFMQVDSLLPAKNATAGGAQKNVVPF